MAAIMIDGKKVATEMKNDVKTAVSKMEKKPSLAVIMVGDNPASEVYVNSKKKDCEECGINAVDYRIDVSKNMESKTIKLIEKLNNDDDIDAILVQLPLPEGIDTKKVISTIDPSKDVDIFTDINLGALITGDYKIGPCTPSAIMCLLGAYSIEVAGKKCVIINRSNLIGKPLAMMLTHEDATVTLCNSHTPNLIEECRTADILITATAGGVKITSEWIKEGAVVFDASMNRDENGNLCGDVQIDDEFFNKASYITPVPGGIGPMTRALLMYNTLWLAKVNLVLKENKSKLRKELFEFLKLYDYGFENK